MFHFFMTTLEKFVFDDQVLSVIVPGIEGYFEVLTNHAPILAALKPGKLIIKDKNEKNVIFAVSGGYFEMSKNEATLLADTAEEASKIDIKRAESALTRANQILATKASEHDLIRAKHAKERAINRVNVYQSIEQIR